MPTSRARNALLALAVLVGAVIPALPASAHEDDMYVFNGSGWGHSIGLSQYGAFGQALEGASETDIVTYYYADTTVESLADLVTDGDIDAGHPLVLDPSPVWVGIRQDVTSVAIEPVAGPFTLCQTVDGGPVCADLGWDGAEPETWSIDEVEEDAEVGCLVTRLEPAPEEGEDPPIGFGDCDMTITWGGEGEATRVALDGDVCTDIGSVGRECFARGVMQIRSDLVPSGFHIMMELGVEEYMYGLGEMPSSWPAEALEAQALAGRSYLVRRVLVRENPELASGGDPGLTTTRKADCWCHLYSTSYDQNYVGYAKETDPTYSPNWITAVDATTGQLITHEAAVPGTVIAAFYHSSSGGHTEDNEAVWGTAALPYLVPVPDPWSNDEPVGNPFTEWSISVTAGELSEELGWDEVTHVSMTAAAPDAQFEFRGTLEGEALVETRNSGWLYYAIGSRSPHFTSIEVDRFEPFLDMTGTGHFDAIYAVWEAGITNGCGDDYYCPDDLVTRSQMATFIARSLELEPISDGPFSDIGHTGLHAGNINAVAEAGISLGCGEGLFCPDELVNRAQMASFLARAMDLEPVADGPFTDLDGVGTHAGAINALAIAEVSNGCAEGQFCPFDVVTRAQMASFIARAFLWVEESEPSGTQEEGTSPS